MTLQPPTVTKALEAYTELEQEALKSVNQSSNFDFETVLTLHPALDYQKGIAVIGFRVQKRTDEGKLAQENAYLTYIDGIVSFSRRREVIYQGETYSIDDSDKLLPTLTDKWSIKGVQEFIENGLSLSPKDLFMQIKDEAEKYFYLSEPTEYNLIAAWIIGTYFHRLFSSFPFLHIKAPKGSGKSQLLAFLEKTAFNGTKARVTAASLGDLITSTRSTLLFDQADCLHGDHHADVKEILTDSYKIDGGKRRIIDMRKSGRKQIEFETFSPKALASTIELPEDLRDRCILIPLCKTNRNYPVPNNENTDWSTIRGNLYKSVKDFETIRDLIQKTRSEYVSNNTLVGRQLDLWLPLAVVMRYVGLSDTEIVTAQAHYVKNYNQMRYEPKEHEVELVELLIEKIGTEERLRISVRDITQGINDKRRKNLDLETIDPKKVGWAIKGLNLFSEEDRDSSGRIYVFKRAKLLEVYNSYFLINGKSIS